MAKFAITLCVVLFASMANTFGHSNNNDKMLIDLATNIKSIEVEMTKNRGYDNIEKIKKVASDLLSNYYEILKTTFISDTMPCHDVLNGPKTNRTECELSCIDSLFIYTSAMVNMSTCTSTNFPSVDNYKTEINNSTIITIALLMQLKAKIPDKGFFEKLFKPTDSIISSNHELKRSIDNLEQNITEIVNAANRSVSNTVTDCLNEKFKHFSNELTKQIDKVNKCRTKLKNNTITEYKAFIEEWAKNYNQGANPFIILDNKVETLKDIAMNETSIKVQMIKNSGNGSIENLKTVASDLLANYSETLKTAFTKDTMPCHDVLNGPKTDRAECDLSCIDSLSIYSSAMDNMFTCTSTNFLSLDNYKNAISNSAIITLLALIQSKTKTPDKGLLGRYFKPTDSIKSFNHELQRSIDNLEQSITETVNAASRSVSKTVTDCLNEKLKHFRNELRKQIANVNECRTKSTKSLNEIINDEVNVTRTELTKLKEDTVTKYRAILVEWGKDYKIVPPYHRIQEFQVQIKESEDCIYPTDSAVSILNRISGIFKKCQTIVEAYEFSGIASTHTTALENYIRDLNKCPIHKSFASIINDTHSTECVMQARTNIDSRWEELRSSIGDVRDSFKCFSERFLEMNATLNDAKNILGPGCPYDDNGRPIFINDLKWNY